MTNHIQRCIRCLCRKVKNIVRRLQEMQKQIDELEPSSNKGINGLAARIVSHKDEKILPGEYFVFDEFINEEDNEDIKVEQTSDGTVFTLLTPGVYHFDWQISLNNDPKYDINIVLEVNDREQRACAVSSNINLVSCSDLVIVKDVPTTVKLTYVGIDPSIEFSAASTQGSLTIIK